MGGRAAQGVLIARSRATAYCEPCQGLTAAALSRRCRVPRGNFEGATYAVSASVRTVGVGAQQTKPPETIRRFRFERPDITPGLWILKGEQHVFGSFFEACRRLHGARYMRSCYLLLCDLMLRCLLKNDLMLRYLMSRLALRSKPPVKKRTSHITEPPYAMPAVCGVRSRAYAKASAQ